MAIDRSYLASPMRVQVGVLFGEGRSNVSYQQEASDDIGCTCTDYTTEVSWSRHPLPEGVELQLDRAVMCSVDARTSHIQCIVDNLNMCHAI